VLLKTVVRRYDTRSTMMTGNRPLQYWSKLIGNVPSVRQIKKPSSV
jgi:hypothetical protein